MLYFKCYLNLNVMLTRCYVLIWSLALRKMFEIIKDFIMCTLYITMK
jgi:hypothetical protein